MTTATKKKEATALSELEALEEDLHQARRTSSESSRNLKQIADLARALLDQRNRLIARNPEQVDRHGRPVGDNEIAKLDKEAAALGDLGELQAELEHRRRIEKAAQRRVDAYISENIGDLVEGVRPEAEAAAKAVIERAADFEAAVNAYIAVHQRSAGLCAPVSGLTAHAVPGINQASDLRRQFRGFTIDAPYPRLSK